ncbi:MAG TPA: acetate--CoA ligase [Aggregatilineales bacterium]|nr:acetate--CoA ligase [Chloroflexota bacterium]HOA25778.1 acetate--CoA ligase [Aggregatilineales bacterium]HQE19871.1 acetate--CoA ligase [Aggregatilineales bacterium]
MLETFFEPKSVAVIGASRDPEKLGYAVVKNLIEGGYVKIGKVYPINPKGGEVLGLPAYPSVLDVEDPIDLAVIVIPYKFVPGAMKECGEKGIPSVVVITAGFREAGKEGLERERELMQIAKQYGIRVIGPNCLGVIDTFTPLNASFAAGTPPKGPINFMSQSGALGTAVLDWSLAGELGFSKFVSLGNKADVSEIDLLQMWADDPNANVIMAYIEGVPSGREFIDTARLASKKKPIVAVKSGVTQAGSRAVSSHTGSLAGSEQAYAAAFKQAGIIRAHTMEQLFDFARAFAYQPLLKGDRIAIITNAGGPGILATDAIERSGLKIARFDNETIKKLESYLPDAASAANPVDVLGDAAGDRYEYAIDVVSQDPNVDGILVVLTPQALTDIVGTAEAVANLCERVDIPVLAVFMGEKEVQKGIDVLTERGVPNYPFPERAVAALRAMADYRIARDEPLPEYEEIDVDREAVKQVFEKVRSEGRVSIGDFEARAILEAYGFKIPQTELASTPEEAVEIAGRIGYPVVLKIASPDILHKTDVGGVRVGLQNAQDVRDAFELMVYRAERYVPGARIWGCTVQEMTPQGLEVLVGMNRDPQFGPLVTFALGGIYVEILKDATFRIAPFSRREAWQMLDEIRAHALLDGVRGRPPVDKEAIVDTLMRVGQLVTDFPEIVELDINPLMVFEKGQGAVAIDMRLVLTSQE